MQHLLQCELVVVAGITERHVKNQSRCTQPDLSGAVVQVRVFELSQLSLKFERHLDSQIVEFQVGCSYLKTHSSQCLPACIQACGLHLTTFAHL